MTERSKIWVGIEPLVPGGWDYRIIKDGNLYTIHEVYYDENGKPDLVTVEPSFPAGDSLDELRKDFEHYQDAWNKPILPIEMFLRKES